MKRYIYFNNEKVVDQTVLQLFEEQGDGISFSEFAKAIIYQHAVQHGYQAELSASPSKRSKESKALKSRQNRKKKTHKSNHNVSVKKEKLRKAAPTPLDDDVSDDILQAVNLIM